MVTGESSRRVRGAGQWRRPAWLDPIARAEFPLRQDHDRIRAPAHRQARDQDEDQGARKECIKPQGCSLLA